MSWHYSVVTYCKCHYLRVISNSLVTYFEVKKCFDLAKKPVAPDVADVPDTMPGTMIGIRITIGNVTSLV